MIEVRNLFKSYGKTQVLKNINMTINPGEITAIIGVNGVGKTTLINAIMQLIHYDAGEIELDGKKIKPEDFNRIAYVPDELIIDQQQTIQTLLDQHARYYQTFNPKRADELLSFFRLKRDQVVSELSKGNRAKVNLLLALSLDVDYILMDEPFSGIDIFTREMITEVFTSDLIKNRGVLITTHEIDDVEILLDKVILLEEGEVYLTFNPEEYRLEKGQSVVDVMREVYNR